MTSLLLALLGAPRSASAADVDPDPWLGKDKALHFAASSAIAAGGYAIGAALFDARGHALLFGGALATAAGVGKEAIDLAGAGTPSWRDLAWDGMGTVTGLAVAWSIDLLLRGVSEKRPLLVKPTLSNEAARLDLVLTF